MREIDLNADVAEGEALTRSDLRILDAVTSASLACGFHAGNRRVMRETAVACRERGVVIGAHVSFRDRPGFGRRALEVGRARLVDDIAEQFGILDEEVGAVGGEVEFVKPHGALYNLMATDPAVAGTVVEAMLVLGGRVLVAQSGSVVVPAARAAGVRVVLEAFPDRGYAAPGRLVPRGSPGAVIDDPEVAGRRAVAFARRGGVDAVDGTWTAVEAETLCVHGDAPGADVTAHAVRAWLEDAGITLAPFLPRRSEPAAEPGPRPRDPT